MSALSGTGELRPSAPQVLAKRLEREVEVLGRLAQQLAVHLLDGLDVGPRGDAVVDGRLDAFGQRVDLGAAVDDVDGARGEERAGRTESA